MGSNSIWTIPLLLFALLSQASLTIFLISLKHIFIHTAEILLLKVIWCHILIHSQYYITKNVIFRVYFYQCPVVSIFSYCFRFLFSISLPMQEYIVSVLLLMSFTFWIWINDLSEWNTIFAYSNRSKISSPLMEMNDFSK